MLMCVTSGRCSLPRFVVEYRDAIESGSASSGRGPTSLDATQQAIHGGSMVRPLHLAYLALALLLTGCTQGTPYRAERDTLPNADGVIPELKTIIEPPPLLGPEQECQAGASTLWNSMSSETLRAASSSTMDSQPRRPSLSSAGL